MIIDHMHARLFVTTISPFFFTNPSHLSLMWFGLATDGQESGIRNQFENEFFLAILHSNTSDNMQMTTKNEHIFVERNSKPNLVKYWTRPMHCEKRSKEPQTSFDEILQRYWTPTYLIRFDWNRKILKWRKTKNWKENQPNESLNGKPTKIDKIAGVLCLYSDDGHVIRL